MFSMLKQTLGHEDNNPILEYFEIGRHVGSSGPESAWKIYEAVRKGDRQDASVFVFEKKIAEKLHKPRRKETVTELLRRSVRLLERLKHPKFLQLLHPVEESSDTLAFAAEPVLASLANLLGNYERMAIPVPDHIKEYEFLDLELKYGILQITEALSYLHGSEQMIHCNICPHSIIVNKKGTWKLFGLSFTEKSQDGSAGDVFPCNRWTSKSPKMTQPDLEFIAPEVQTGTTCSALSDMFSLGLVIACLYNNGKPLIEANHSSSNYVKSLEQLDSRLRNIMDQVPIRLQEPLQKLLSRDVKQRPTAQLFSLIKYFNDPAVSALQFIDVIDQKDSCQKADFFFSLKDTLPVVSKKLWFQHILPCIRNELKDPSLVASMLHPLAYMIEHCSEKEYQNLLMKDFREILNMTKNTQFDVSSSGSISWQAMVILLSKLEVVLPKTPPEDAKSEIMPIVFKALNSSTNQIQDAALNCIGSIKDFIDENEIRDLVLPQVKSLYPTQQTIEGKVRVLDCLNKIMGRLDKSDVVDEVLPFLIKIQSHNTELMMANIRIYKHMLSDKKFGLSPDLIATKIMPPLIPLTIASSLNMEQFNLLMEVLKEMLEHIDRNQRNKFKLDTLTLLVPERPPNMRHRHSLVEPPAQIEVVLCADKPKSFLSVDDIGLGHHNTRSASISVDRNRLRPDINISPGSQRRHSSTFQGFGATMNPDITISPGSQRRHSVNIQSIGTSMHLQNPDITISPGSQRRNSSAFQTIGTTMFQLFSNKSS